MRRDIVVVGASAGGVNALSELVRPLPVDFAGALFVVMHVPRAAPSALTQILARAGRLAVTTAREGEAIERGRIYVAAPDWHLVLGTGAMHLRRGPTENGFRPAIDPLFRSAAQAFGPRVVGIVLTGGLDDGTQGLRAIKAAGGLAMVQDPDEAPAPSMPRSALRHVAVDHRLPVRAMAAVLAREASAVESPAEAAPTRSSGVPEATDEYSRGRPSAFSCPACRGVLWELDDEGLLRYRCRVGHAYSSLSVVAAQTAKVEDELWAALRGLDESLTLARRVAHREGATEDAGVVALRNLLREVEHEAAALRAKLERDLDTEGP